MNLLFKLQRQSFYNLRISTNLLKHIKFQFSTCYIMNLNKNFDNAVKINKSETQQMRQADYQTLTIVDCQQKSEQKCYLSLS